MFQLTGTPPELVLHVNKWAVHLTEQPPQPCAEPQDGLWGETPYGGYAAPSGWVPPSLEPHDVGLELEMLADLDKEGDTTFVFYDADMLDEFLALLGQSFEVPYTVEPLDWERYAAIDGLTVSGFEQAEQLMRDWEEAV